MRIPNPFRRRLACVALTVILAETTALAADLTLFGGAGDWNDPTNWNPSIVAGAVINWSGGRASGSLSVASGGMLNLTGSGTKGLDALLSNARQANWTDGAGPNNHGPVVKYASADLQTSTPIYTNAPTINPIEYLDTSATNYPQ